jgi:hypothetical protein
MRHFDDVHRGGPSVESASLSPILGVPEEQGALASPLDQQDHARVVRVEQAFSAGGPEHAHACLPHRKCHVPAQARD